MGDVVALRRRREDDTPDDEHERSDPPPHDLDAEAAVLSAVLLDRDALDRALEILKPEHFYSEANARIFQAIQALALMRTPVDMVTVGCWLREQGWLQKMGGTAYLAELADATPAVGHVGAHAETVLAAWEDRELLGTLQRCAVEARRPHQAEGGRDGFRARARASLGRATAPRVQLVGAPMGAIVDQVRAHLDAAQRERTPTGIAWPFERLDGFGLIQQGTQEVITGRPGMGKTGFTFQITRRICEAEPVQGMGEAVYWWSGEMDPVLLVLREAANTCGILFSDLLRQRVKPDRLERFSRVLDRFRHMAIWWDHEPATPEQLAARVRKVKALFESGKARRADGHLFAQARLRVVAIDQLSELKPPEGISPRADKREIVGATAKTLRRETAVKLKVATLLLVQLARPKDPSKVELPTLAELRESGALEESADGVTAIHRRGYYLRQRTPDEWKNVSEVLRLKGRYGEADDVKLGFYAGKFSDRLPAPARGEAYYEGQNDEGDNDE